MIEHPKLTRRAFLAGVAATPVLAACGGGDDGGDSASETTTTTEATTTTPPPPPNAPLTGLPFTGDPAVLARPALVVKINNIDTNTDQGRPQAGINEADVVFEERTEGGITRFAAVFHSTDADPVLPVRSARYTDIDICSMLNRPLFANSGGNAEVMSAVRDANLVEIGNNTYGDPYYYRVGDRRAPHNLATSTPQLYTLAEPDQAAPNPLFTYRPAGTPLPGGRPAVGVHVEYGGGPAQAPVDHTFDAALGGWARSQNGTAHVDVNGVHVAPPNLIVQHIEYDGTSGILVGGGVAWIFSGDLLIEGFWERPDPAVPTQFLDAASQPVSLLPGRTWVLLPPPGGATLL